jgi:predicted transcriptional regulator
VCQEREALEKVERARREKITQSIMTKEREYMEHERALKVHQRTARRLEQVEAQVLQRLKETHRQQRDAIVDIEKIMKASAGVLSQETIYTVGSARVTTPPRR